MRQKCAPLFFLHLRRLKITVNFFNRLKKRAELIQILKRREKDEIIASPARYSLYDGVRNLPDRIITVPVFDGYGFIRHNQAVFPFKRRRQIEGQGIFPAPEKIDKVFPRRKSS